MRSVSRYIVCFLALTLFSNCKQQTLKPTQVTVVSTLAGAGTRDSGVGNNEDGMGTSAFFSNPNALAVDAAGNVYVADDRRIRKISPSGLVTTIAGDGSYGTADGQGLSATFFAANAITVDAGGNLYVVDNQSIRKITPSGLVTTLAGSGDHGSADGTGIGASFNYPGNIVADALGNLYVADAQNNEIRKISPAGTVSTFAGSTTGGFTDGAAGEARFSGPIGLAIDASGNLYVGDSYNKAIRKITPSGTVSTITTNNQLANIYGISVDHNGNIYGANNVSNQILKWSPSGHMSIIAGSGTPGDTDGPASKASFNGALDVAASASNDLFVADTHNFKIRKIATSAN
ncbi:MAG: hypothetical protein ACHQHN_07615 [Sphingobacteriales bacterium]